MDGRVIRRAAEAAAAGADDALAFTQLVTQGESVAGAPAAFGEELEEDEERLHHNENFGI